jgi:N-acetylglucosamine-6-phosphate deacetylase
MVDGQVVGGDVEVADGVVVAVGLPGRTGRGLAVPGFVDLQVNGFGGVDFLACDTAGYRQARACLATFGVTSFLPTLVSSPPGLTQHALRQAGHAQHEPGPRILGVHLEGPFLSPDFKGAHDPACLLPPDPGLAERLLNAGPVAAMTLAPELPGGMELVAWLAQQGVVVSLGHTGADAAAANEAYNRGARTVTHLYNAQRRFSARDPGVTGVALIRADVVVQLIADFVHLAPETVLGAWLAAKGRLALVTDSTAPTGMGPAEPPRLPDGTLAGSVLTMDLAVRNLMALGVGLADAVGAASAVPARLMGRPDLATLHPGTPADIAVLDDDVQVVRTLVAGDELFAV